MVAPIPSEAVMPFAGFLIVEGQFSMRGVVVASSLGSTIGSLISYYLGFYGGKVFVRRVGRYLFLDEGHLEWTHRFFERYGEPTIFVGRFIPAVRHLISIPAGVGKMNILMFTFFTVVGATCWNFILAYAGMHLKERWEVIHNFSEYIDVTIVILVCAFMIFYIWSHKKRV
jgi:membrane protein DedA with SNARE-associated domain